MDYNILLGLLISYSITYFILRSKLPKKKIVCKLRRKTFSINPYTFIVHTLLTFAFLFNVLSIRNVLIILLYLILHWGIDEALEMIEQRFKDEVLALWIFFADKLIRIVPMLFASYMIKMHSLNYATFYGINEFISRMINLFPAQITYQNKLLIALFLFIIALWGVGRFIALIIDHINKSGGVKAPEALKAGFLIGILERVFIICSIILGMPQVIGFVLAAKSVARLSKLNEDYFVEIFIIGNFISFISAIIIGVIIKNLDIFPYLIRTIE